VKKLIQSIVMLAMLMMLVTPVLGINQTSPTGKLVYIAEQYPPFNFQENGKLKGISIDLLEKMLNRMDSKLNRSDIKFMPWSQGYRTALTENNTVFISMARLPEWESSFKWVGPICPTQTVVFAMQDRTVRISSLADLNKYKIGVVRGSAEQYLLTRVGVNVKNVVPEEDGETIVKMLKSGDMNIDAWANAELPGIWLMNRSGIMTKDYNTVYNLGDEAEIYYAFNKETPDSLIQAFQRSLNLTKQEKSADGTSDYDKILYKNLPVRYVNEDEPIIRLVNEASLNIEKDAPGTLRKIAAGMDPYKERDNPELYIYVYDTNVTFVAHADNPTLNGFNFKGKADVSGKKFADETVAGAIKYGTGWVDYIWTNPAKSGLYYKTAYYRLTRGSDGKQYIVCAGKYRTR
jgi:polar amino acid transport system substrate-binding protein